MRTKSVGPFRRSSLTLQDAYYLGRIFEQNRFEISGAVNSINPASDPDGSWTAGTLRISSAPESVGFVTMLPVGGLEVGRAVQLVGYWDEHAEYGVQFHIERVLRSEMPVEHDWLIRYLEYNVGGIGKKKAAELVRIYGRETLVLLRKNPDLPRQLWKGAAGERASLGVRDWLTRVSIDRWMWDIAPRLMEAAKITPAMAYRISSFFTSAEVAELIARRDTYRLLDVPGLGWKRSDAIARSLGVKEQAPERVQGAVRWAMREIMGRGHSATTLSVLADAAREVLRQRVPLRNVKRAIAQLVVDGDLLRDHGLLYQEDAFCAESDVADLVRWLLRLRRPLSDRQAAQTEEVLKASPLDADQADGVRLALSHAVAILTGRPGTGKTTTLRTLIRVCSQIGIPVQVAAPTGKAAARAREVTGLHATTIHKMLGGPVGSEREGGPICDGLLIVDEASMLDVEVFAWLALNIKPGPNFRLLLVGDENQLPSVGHGQVLTDLIASARAPMVRLTKIRRQAANSTITVLAHSLLDGHEPVLDETPDFRFVEVSADPEKAQDEVVEAVHRAVKEERDSILRRLENCPFDACRDLQVLTPRNEGHLGINKLNPRIGSLINPQPEPGPWIGGGMTVRVRDRVICTENDYTIGESGLMNGEQGVVESYNTQQQSIRIRLDDGRIVETRGERQNNVLSLGFAVTAHRSQGSEYQVAVVVFHSSQYPLLDLRVLYTAITRARQRLILCADPEALRKAMRGGMQAGQRVSGLSRRL